MTKLNILWYSVVKNLSVGGKVSNLVWEDPLEAEAGKYLLILVEKLWTENPMSAVHGC